MSDDLMGTLVWLATFPSSEGFFLLFLAGFALPGLLMLSASNRARPSVLLASLQSAQSGSAEKVPPGRLFRGALQMWVYRLLLLLVVAGAIIGGVSLATTSFTLSYIAEHGATAQGHLEDDKVTFVATDGRTYVRPFSAMSPQQFPRDSYLDSTGQVTVRYLEDHPQAYTVIGVVPPE